MSQFFLAQSCGDAPALERVTESELAELRGAVESAVVDSQDLERQMRTRLRAELERLAIKEERLYDLAAEEEFRTDRLKDRLRAINIERAAVEERLEQTDSQIELGFRHVLALFELLSNPVELF